MHVQFTRRDKGPERLVSEAELHFDEGLLAGLRLVGFSLWRGSDSEVYVTFPSRASGVGADRKYFDYLRGDTEAIKRFKAFVLDEYRAASSATAPAPAEQSAPLTRRR